MRVGDRADRDSNPTESPPLPYAGAPMEEPATIDELLTEIVKLTAGIEAADPGSTERERLEERRDSLRTLARTARDNARSDADLENELGTLLRRLAHIDDRPIDKGWTEKTNYRWFNDPGAYSSQINRKINEQDEDERADIVKRIAEIEAVLSARSSDA